MPNERILEKKMKNLSFTDPYPIDQLSVEMIFKVNKQYMYTYGSNTH